MLLSIEICKIPPNDEEKNLIANIVDIIVFKVRDYIH